MTYKIVRFYGRPTEVTKYQIVRFYDTDQSSNVIRTGLTLEEAQSWCRRADTHGPGWFDRYAEQS